MTRPEPGDHWPPPPGGWTAVEAAGPTSFALADTGLLTPPPPPPPPPPPSSHPPDPADAPERPRLRTRIVRRWPEIVVVVGALVMFAWGLGKNGYGNDYYAAAARSMTHSWSNFFYAAFDPGGWITVDKPPLAFWLQALSARVFGYSGLALLLPSVLCGAGAVALLMAAVRRAWGRTAGLVAGIALACTPVLLAVSRSNNPDVTLVLCMVAAGYATQRAISDRKPRWLYLAGLFIGLAFLAKLLVALLIVPGLWLAYLVTGPSNWKRRMGHLALATLVMVGVSGAWVASVDLRPLGDRPYIGGSVNGNALDLVLGYNGIGRLTGNNRGQASGGARPPGGFGGGGGPNGIDQFGGTPGITRLFNNGMGDQVMWLAPLAGAALVGGLALALWKRKRDAETGALLLWGGWAGTTYVVFAFAEGIYHNYYVAALAPAVAALAGIGVALARRHRMAGALAIAVVALATAKLQRVFLDRVDAYQWLRVVVPVGLVAVAVGAVVVALQSAWRQRAVPWLAGVGLGLALLPAAIWTWNGTRTAQNGTFPDARPVSATLRGFGGPGGFAGPPGGGVGGAGGFGGMATTELDWLRSQRTTERWLVAESSSMQASGAIMAGDSVMAMGGFSGNDPAMTVSRLADLVDTGELRFVAAGGGGFLGGGRGGVSSAVRQVCTSVDASNWGGSGASGIYDCQGKGDALRSVSASTTSSDDPGGGTGGPGGFPGGGLPGGPNGGPGGFAPGGAGSGTGSGSTP